MALLGSTFDLVDKYILGYALGVAAGPALRPFVQDLANEAWTLNQDMPLAAGVAAAIAAEDVDLYDAMATEATLTGVNAGRFKDLYGVTLTAPGMGELLTALRRGKITPDDFSHGLRKAKLETRWDVALSDLQHVRLTPQQLALGIVRNVVADPGLLAATLDLAGGIVPAYPTWPGDALAEALAGGIDKDRLRVMVGEIGLPMSAQQAASAYFRHIIELGDFNRAILEGDTRPEWAPYILDQARQIPTAHDGIEYRLRGWTDDAGMYAQTARHGMSKADTDLLLKVTGRPLSFHQVFIGERRGGTFNGPTAGIDPAFLKSLQESNIRPEWYNLAWAQRYTYPSAFVLRALTQGGDLTQAETHTILLDIGWEATLAEKVSTKWAGGSGTTGDAHVKKAQTQLWSALHRSYVDGDTDAVLAQTTLSTLGVAATSQPQVLALWDAERSLTRKELSPSQLKKAYKEAIVNPATGIAFTKDEVVAELVTRGFSVNDATVFVET